MDWLSTGLLVGTCACLALAGHRMMDYDSGDADALAWVAAAVVCAWALAAHELASSAPALVGGW